MGRRDESGRRPRRQAGAPAIDPDGFATLSKFLNEADEEALVREAEEWNRQIVELEAKRDSYERLLRGMVRSAEERTRRRER